MQRTPVLIVSPDVDLQDLYVCAFRASGRAAHVASTCTQATTLARESAIGVIVVDIGAEADWETCRQLTQHENTKHLPIVALSGYVASDHRFRRRAFEARCAAFVAKPVRPSVLDSVIERVAAGETGIEVMVSDGL